jgi:DNA ligase (NAD+)
MMNEKEKQIAEIEASIRRHNRLYYDEDNPEIGDVAYDRLKERLKELSPDSPVLDELGNPSYGKKFTHAVIMGSLDKAHTVDELIERFDGQVVAIMPKIDGLSLALHYDHGGMELAATRGDGTKGEEVTACAARVSNIPLQIEYTGKCEVRGEGYIAKKDFYGIMDQPGYDGKPDGLKNPRNAAAGGIRQKDPSKTAAKKVRFVAYRYMPDTSYTQKHWMKWLDKLGFETCPIVMAQVGEHNRQHLQEIIDGIRDMDVPYDIDGAVVMLDDIGHYTRLGYNRKNPVGAMAYKYETERTSTIVEEINWNASRTGRIVPVATFEPVELCGTTVTHATLNNADLLREKQVAVGDRILIEKANEIIPQVIEVIEHSGKPLVIPTNCPSCEAELEKSVRADGTAGADLICPNEECPAKFVKLAHHVLVTLDIKGIAVPTLEKLAEAGMIEKPEDIFTISVERLTEAGFGQRESEIMVEAVSGVEATPARILKALGIHGWGESLFTSLFKVSDIPEEEWLKPDFTDDKFEDACKIGPTRGPQLREAWEGKKGLLNALCEHVSVLWPTSEGLGGKSFCITGTLSKGRTEIQDDIREAGGVVKSSVSSGLDFLVAGDKAGGKKKKAEDKGVQVISESELYEMTG